MRIEPFSKHIFWSYKPDADLPENLVIQQVVAYGEFSDLRLISKLISAQRILQAIEQWKNKHQHKKRINLLKQIFLYDQN